MDDQNKCNSVLIIKNITASGDYGKENGPSNVNDGNLSTWWSSQGTGSWIGLDVGPNKIICSINIAGYKADQRHYNFDISTSADANAFTKVASYTSSGATLNPEKFTISPTKARYIQVLVTGNTQIEGNIQKNFSSISEINVYGQNDTGTPNDKSGDNGVKTQTNNESIPSISVGTDDSKYSQGEHVAFVGRIYNGTGFSSETLKLIVNKTHYEKLGHYYFVNQSEVVAPATVISLLSDSFGRYNYNMSFQEVGKYLVSTTANLSGKKVESFAGFEVNSIFYSHTAYMIYLALISFIMLLVIIWLGNRKFGNLSDPKKYRLNLDKIASYELLRFLCLSAIAGFSLLSFIFADSEIGVNSPIGLVKQNFGTLNKTEIQTAGQMSESQWVINVGGIQNDNYAGGIQIPTSVIVFGLAGGYLRYLYGMRFFFGRWKKGDQFEDTDKNWGDLNAMDNMSFLRHSLRSLSLFFLSPLLAIVVWFILFQGGTTGKWAIAAVSFSIGLITEEVIQVIISFVRKMLVGIKEETVKEKEDTKVKVLKTIPADGSSGVSVFTDILATFEVPVDNKTVDQGFKLSIETNGVMDEIPGEVTQSEDILTYRFVPTNRKLDPDKTYVATIDGVVDLVGRACETIAWLFSTRSRPTILTVKPEEKKVSIYSKIVVNFSEPVDKKSVENNFFVTENNTRITGNINVVGKSATFTPRNNKFKKNKTYKVELTDQIKDMAGNALVSGKKWEFSTE